MIAFLQQYESALYRLSIAQYHAMAEKGILACDERVELLEGLLIQKAKKSPRYACARSLMNDQFTRRLPDTFVLFGIGTFLMKASEQEPDFMIVHGPLERYSRRHPKSREVGLIIEIGDESQIDNRRYKSKLYAQAKIPQLWLVNLVDEVVEVHTSPRGGKEPAYQVCTIYRRGESVPLTLAGEELGSFAVADLLP